MPAGCFAWRRPAPPPSPPPPSSSTSLYHTPLGPAALTWSRSLLGISLSFLLPIPAQAATDAASPSSSSTSSSSPNFPASRLSLRPAFLWRRRGSRRFRIGAHGPPVLVDVSWDLSRARFAGGGPEPTAGFFLAVAVDEKLALLIGDEGGCRKARGKLPRSAIATPAVPSSRRDHVVVADGGAGRWPCEYVTRAWAGGRERKVAVEIGGRAEKDVRLCVAVDGKRVLQVKRLRWKFRGNQWVDLDDGTSAVLISWDVHNYLFPSSTTTSAPPSDRPLPLEPNHAIIALCFETEPKPQLWGRPTNATALAWGNANGYGLLGNGAFAERIIGVGMAKHRKLLKTRSASSASSVASSGSGWSVAEWQSTEENELKEVNGFSLVISFARC